MGFRKQEVDPQEPYKPVAEVMEIGNSKQSFSRRTLEIWGGVAALVVGIGIGYQLDDGATSSSEPVPAPHQTRAYTADVFAKPSIWTRPIGQISGPVEVVCGIYDYNTFPNEDDKPAFQPNWYRVYNYNVGEAQGFVRMEHVALHEVAPPYPTPVVNWVQLEHDVPGIDAAERSVLGDIVR
jgi:hypothetical protein